MGKEDKQEEGKSLPPEGNHPKEKFVIKIPSYDEVLEISQSKTTTSASTLFEPSTSFSQAFSFIKKSDFYSPPSVPPVPQAEQPCPPQHPSSSASTSSQSIPPPQRQIGQSEVAAPAVSTRNAILVSNRQKGNPLLKHIRNVRWSFADIVCDYLLGNNSCALYLSLRYHLLHPDYLYYRIRELQKNYKLRIVLCHVDVEDVVKPLLEVTKTALLHDCTLLCAWSLEECGRYLETIKVYENKPADLIQGQMDSDYLSRLNHALTAVRHVNKTDVVTLGSTFGSLANIMDGSMEDLARCPGIGERKVKRLYDTFHEPFKRVATNQSSRSEPSSQVGADTNEANEDVAYNVEDKSRGKKKATEVNVRSALSAAFAKYSDRIDRTKKSRKNKGDEEEEEEKTVSLGSNEKSSKILPLD